MSPAEPAFDGDRQVAAPPHSREAERGVVAITSLDPHRIEGMAAIVEPRDFYDPSLSALFAIAMRLHRDGVVPDSGAIIAATREFRNAGELQEAYRQAVESIPTAMNAEWHAKTMREHAVRRRAIDRLRGIAWRIEKGESLVETLNAAHYESGVLSDELGGVYQAMSGRSANYRRASDIPPEQVNWLWHQRIALGKMSMLVSDPGNGKSTLVCDIASRITNGLAWPDDCLSTAPRGGVILMNCEDDAADTTVPRLIAHGADLSQVVLLESVRDKLQDNRDVAIDMGRDLEIIEQAVDTVDDCRAIFIDPFSAYLGKVDSHNNAEVRALMAPYAAFAARKKLAIIFVGHFSKGQGSAINRPMGSLAFVAAARSAWALAKDRDDPHRRLLVSIKNNIGPEQGGLAFRLTGGAIEWEADRVDITAEEALAVDTRKPGPDADERNYAEEFLRTELRNGPKPTKEVEQTAKQGHRISERTLNRARKALGVVAFQNKNPGAWFLKLPEAQDHSANRFPDT